MFPNCWSKSGVINFAVVFVCSKVAACQVVVVTQDAKNNPNNDTRLSQRNDNQIAVVSRVDYIIDLRLLCVCLNSDRWSSIMAIVFALEESGQMPCEQTCELPYQLRYCSKDAVCYDVSNHTLLEFDKFHSL